MRLAVSNDGSSILKTQSIPTPADFEKAVSEINRIGLELSGGEKIAKVVGGIAGPLDKEKTMLVASAHIPGWVKKPLKQSLQDVFNCEVFLENDSTLDGLGEAVSGSGQGFNIVAYLAIGTGVGGTRIVRGKIDENAWGFEPGHQIIVPDGNPCNCGGRGHLETYVSGFYLEKNYHQKAEKISDPKIWDEIAGYLAIGLNNTILHWSPDIVVLGGSVGSNIPLNRVEAYLDEDLIVFPNKPKLSKARLDYPGLNGALHLINPQNS